MKANDIIFLIGAGCSADAGIPVSSQMIEKTESLLKTNRDWEEFRDLYHFLKETIIYGDKLTKNDEEFNIERLLTILNDLERNKRHSLFPFFLGWSPLLIELAGPDFKNVSRLKAKIRNQMPQWVTLNQYTTATYYKSFFDFQQRWQYPLRIFSLNYDICLEENTPAVCSLEQGFGDENEWSGDRFYIDSIPVNVYLYKLHGSVSWYRDTGNILRKSKKTPLTSEEADLIFGTDLKLQSIDPYLFYVYEFRKYSLESRLIITIGYSFSDDYVNSLVKQALEHDRSRKLVAISFGSDEPMLIKRITSRLRLSDNKQISVRIAKARDFLEKELTTDYLQSFIVRDGADVF